MEIEDILKHPLFEGSTDVTHLFKPNQTWEEFREECDAGYASAFRAALFGQYPGKEPDYLGYRRTLFFNFDSLTISQIYLTDRPLTGCKVAQTQVFDQAEEMTKIEKPEVDYVRESLNRTKKIFRRLIMHNYTTDTRLVTLTYATACHDRDEHYHNLSALSVRFKKHYGVPLSYIAVPEFHPKGHGYHFHLVVNNAWFDYAHFTKHLWRLGMTFVSDRPDKPEFANAANLADYLTTYIKKDMEHTPVAKKRYSRGGTWRTDWAVSTGRAPEAGKTFRKVLAYLTSLDIPCQSSRFIPYLGQTVYSITFDSGRYPDLDLSPCFREKGPPPVSPLRRKGPKLIQPEQGSLYYEV